MKLKIFKNEIDAADFIEKDYECLLTEWLSIRTQYPNARLYKGVICIQNDVTPKTKEQALALLHADEDYQVLCHAGEPTTIFYAVVAIISIGMAIYTYMNMPKISATDTSGSSNNSLGQRQNKHRVNERVTDIYGTQKSVPDLIAPVYRYYQDNVQVEECLMCIGRGEFDINEDLIKEGETPVNTIEGASLSAYAPMQDLLSTTPQVQIGEIFESLPQVTKQVNSIDGKQQLVSPNNTKNSYQGVIFEDNKIIVSNDTQYIEKYYSWYLNTGGGGGNWKTTTVNRQADFTQNFSSNEQIIIENAIYGSASDVTISGTTDIEVITTTVDEVKTVNITGVITIASKIDITDPNKFKKIRISSFLVTDATSGQLDLSGEYTVQSIVKSGQADAWVYEVKLGKNFGEVNPNFTLLTDHAVAMLSGTLTDNDDNIDLSGTYTISSVNTNEITLVNPESVNSDWNRLKELSDQQIADMYKRSILFKGSSENFIGWYYAGSKDSTKFILNFLAQNGIYEGDRSKQVAVEVQYQQVVNGMPTGQIYRVGDTMQGKANSRSPVGLTIANDLPFKGQFRFRVKRQNDNGSSSNLIDDVVFESAYSAYQTTKSSYDDVTIVRLKRLAIGSGTNASELNMIVTRKIYSYAAGARSVDKIATSDFADIVCDIATDDYIGRMSIDEVDVSSLYVLSTEIKDYFGTSKACEFNYTFDDKNNSYQEMVFAIAEAVFSTARRENGSHYFVFEKINSNSLILFNHRNMKPESLTITEHFGIPDDYDGIEFKWRDPDDNYAEAIIKLPDAYQTNYKTVDSTGITNKVQAHFHAWRAWNRLQYSRQSIEFTGYGETDAVTRSDRIAVVDSTVPKLGSGQIEAQDNTVLTLDQPVSLDATKSYVIHLQTIRGGVDVVPITRVLNEYQIEIERIPLMPLVISNAACSASFSITLDDDLEHHAYLIDEKNPSATFENSVTASNYSDLYYANDQDFIKNLI